MQATDALLLHLKAMRNRIDAARARADTGKSATDRRARTRHLIELGGLVMKSGLVDLVDDDRATMLGALLEIADRLRPESASTRSPEDATPDDLKARWRRRGLRAFDADRDAADAGMRGNEALRASTRPPESG